VGHTSPNTKSQTVPEVVVEAPEVISAAQRAYAADRIAHAARSAPRPVLYARAVLEINHNPSRERPAACKAALDVSGRPVRAHIAAERIEEAIDLVEARLERSLRSLAERTREERRPAAPREAGEWQHGSLPEHRPEYFPRPLQERRVIRHRALEQQPITAADAAYAMRLLHFQFHLFVNADTTRDSVVYERPDDTLGLLQVGGGAPDAPATIRPNPISIPPLTVDDARERLDAVGEPFVFFVDSASDRGAVLYRRYDGHYGLTTLATATLSAG
jgi:ribosome-associated translation inhibitor RaiA